MLRCAEAKRHRAAARARWPTAGNGDERSLEIVCGTAFCAVSGCIRSDRMCVPVCFKVEKKNMERNEGMVESKLERSDAEVRRRGALETSSNPR